MIELLVLHSIFNKTSTMYSIKKYIETTFSPFITPSFGAVQPALKRLEEKECIKSGKLMSDGGRLSIYYTITKKGKDELKRLILEDMSQNPSQFFLLSRLKLLMLNYLDCEERKRLFLIIKSLAFKFKNEALDLIKKEEGDFYYNIMLDNLACEYANLLTVVESLEKNNASNS